MSTAGIRYLFATTLSAALLAVLSASASAQTGGYYYQGDWPVPYDDRAPVPYVRAEPPQSTLGSGKITVRVPDNAKVQFNELVSPNGYARRWFESPALRRDQGFTVTIRAEWMDGKMKVEQSRTVVVHAGENVNIDLARQAASSAGATTVGVTPSSPPAPSGTRTDRQSQRP
jgi:uncharacterized protein (TIGR03000 family)